MGKKILIFTLILLILLAGYFTYEKNRVLTEEDFVLNDTSFISRIIISKDTATVMLSKENGKWMVNKAFDANTALIKRFFKTFSNLSIVAPISNRIKDSIMNDLEKNALEIQIFEGNNEAYNYLLGNMNRPATGNYLMCNGRTAILNSGSVIKDLKEIVSINSLFWRNKIVFNKIPGTIKSVQIDNIKHPEKSFKIEKQNDKTNFFISGKIFEKYDTQKINRFLTYFSNIYFEQIETKLTKKQLDTILNQNKAWKISLSDINNIDYELNLYLKPEKIYKDSLSTHFDLNKIYGKMNKEKHILIFNYYVIDPILKEPDYFFQK